MKIEEEQNVSAVQELKRQKICTAMLTGDVAGCVCGYRSCNALCTKIHPYFI